MSYTFLLEQGEVSSAESFSDIPQSVLSRLNLTAEKSCCNGSGTESSPSSQSGMMSKPSTGNLGGEKSMSSAGDSLAQTSALPEKHGESLSESKEKKAAYGEKWLESFARFDLVSSSLKTHQHSLFEEGCESLKTLPKWGMMRGGELFQQKCAVPPTNERECGFWLPTPCKSDWNGSGRSVQSPKGYGAKDNLKNYMSIVHGWLYVPVSLAEWLMGWPVGWTGDTPLETDRFQQWLRSHGGH